MHVFSEKMIRVVELRETKHLTFKDIGKVLGVSATRANSLYKKALWVRSYHAEKNDNPYYGLSVRASNCLNNFNLMNREEIMTAIKDKRLSPGLISCRNFGRGTYLEVLKWLGIPLPVKTCPHCGGEI